MRENSKKTTHLFSVSLPSQLSKKTKQQLRPRRRPGRRRPRRPAPGAQDGQARRGEDEEGLRRAAVQVAGGTADRDEVKKKRVFFFFAYLLISQVTIYIYILFFTINRMEKERGKRKGGGREGCCWRRERNIFFFFFCSREVVEVEKFHFLSRLRPHRRPDHPKQPGVSPRQRLLLSLFSTLKHRALSSLSPEKKAPYARTRSRLEIGGARRF